MSGEGNILEHLSKTDWALVADTRVNQDLLILLCYVFWTKILSIPTIRHSKCELTAGLHLGGAEGP